MGAVIVIGLIHPLALHAAQLGRSLLPAYAAEAVSVLLVLKAFSAGCSALTGVEAIANGVPLFRRPRQARAKRTELLLGLILGAMLAGLAVLADRWHIGPRSGETVLSQIIAAAVGRNWAYVAMSLTITVVLALAANTSFGGLPVLASLLARDHFLPHLFSLRDDRQVFAPGILTLAILSGALLVAVGGSTQTLIPLFAIGVFTGFTLSQSGLVVYWRRNRPPRWHHRAAINGAGAIVTAAATVIFLFTKFTEDAWVVVLAVPSFIDQLRDRHTEQIIVLVPVTVPDRLRYRLLHNHLDLVLTAALRHRPDVVTARVPLPLHLPPGRRGTSHAAGSQPD